MKALAGGLLLLSITLAPAGSALAEDEATTTAAAKGRVVSVDATAKTLVVAVESKEGESQDVTFTLDAGSKIQKKGEAVALADLDRDEDVAVTYRAVQGKNVVVLIEVATDD